MNIMMMMMMMMTMLTILMIKMKVTKKMMTKTIQTITRKKKARIETVRTMVVIPGISCVGEAIRDLNSVWEKQVEEYMTQGQCENKMPRLKHPICFFLLIERGFESYIYII